MGEVLLSDLNINEKCELIKYKNETQLNLKKRLLELGFIKGTKIRVAQLSMLKEVFLVELNGYSLSLRKNVAECIIVKRVEK